MTAEEYFGDWIKVIDRTELYNIMRWLQIVDKETLCPTTSNIFKAFRLCPLKDCKVVMLGQDPYPQKGVATGILFGNINTPENSISPSLNIIKEAVINYEIPHNHIEFDNSLESWAKQGILMINSALTCEVDKVGSHFNIWKPFISKLLQNLSIYEPGLIYVLFGNQASSFKGAITNASKIMEVYHPAFYARKCEKMPYRVFTDLIKSVERQFGYKLELYKESEYGTC